MTASGIEQLHRAEFGRILASLIQLVGDFDLAEDAVQDAFTAAVEQWPRLGTPRNPVAWIVGTARHKAIDRMRRNRSFDLKREEILRLAVLETPEDVVPDDRLRLIFTCCHPALATEAQIALSL